MKCRSNTGKILKFKKHLQKYLQLHNFNDISKNSKVFYSKTCIFLIRLGGPLVRY
jgi:hypothetical protein